MLGLFFRISYGIMARCTHAGFHRIVYCLCLTHTRMAFTTHASLCLGSSLGPRRRENEPDEKSEEEQTYRQADVIVFHNSRLHDERKIIMLNTFIRCNNHALNTLDSHSITN